MEPLQLKSRRPSLCQTHMMDTTSTVLPDILWMEEARQQRQKWLSVFHVSDPVSTSWFSCFWSIKLMCVPFSSDAPKDTSASISPSGLVSAGSWVELSCSSRAKPPASFTWFRKSKHGAINVSVGQVYSFNVTEGGDSYCEATNDLGTQRSAVFILEIKGIFLKAI